MQKTLIILIFVFSVVAPIVLVARYVSDEIDAAYNRALDKVKNLIPTWIRGE